MPEMTKDVLIEPWTTPSGAVVVLKSSPHACCEVDESLEEMADFLEKCIPALLEEAADTLTDNILKSTLAEAERYATKFKGTTVSHALNIRAVSYFSKTRMHMSGENLLELPYFEDDGIKLQGRVPIPAVLDYQVDYMAIQYMLGQMKLVTYRLNTMITGKNNSRHWYEIYLTCFVLLCSLEAVHARQVEILRRFLEQHQNVVSKVRHIGQAMLEEWEFSAKNLIYHFRGTLKGMVPFAMLFYKGYCTELQQRAGLDKDAVDYIKTIIGLIQSREKELCIASKEDLDNESAKPLTWISRLYMDYEE